MASIYIVDNDNLLMLYRIGSRVVLPSWCGIGGHFEKEELNDAKLCVLRELFEEIRLCENDIKNIKLRYITLRLKNDEVRQNYYFFAELENGVSVSLKCDEGRPEWIHLNKVCELDMPFTAKHIIKHYVETGIHTDLLYGCLASSNDAVFSVLNEFL